MALAISQVCHDKIVEFEIGSRAYYEKVAKHPSWPGGMSGVTIGIGYDLGQHTAAQFSEDWAGTGIEHDPDLQAVCGHSGSSAKWLAHSCYDSVISYEAAVAVFDKTVLPRYIAMTDRAFPNCARLPIDAFGALVDLVFNRGGDTGPDDRRAEMRAIRIALASMHVMAVPGYIRSMKRLWPSNTALLARREWEAHTFEDALVMAHQGPVSPIVHTTPVSPVRHPVLPSRPRPPAAPVDLRDTSSDVLNQQELDRVRRQNNESS